MSGWQPDTHSALYRGRLPS
uniref:Uncharacterized protein n=1 Tax=Rhizophora mucronata TaxID=61149 RepID=A0A2P2QFZ8_RHIMU